MSKGLEALQHLYAIASVHTKLEKISYMLDLHHAIEKELHALEIIFSHKLLNYILKNEKCRNMYHLSQEDYELLKEVHSWFMSQ